MQPHSLNNTISPPALKTFPNSNRLPVICGRTSKNDFFRKRRLGTDPVAKRVGKRLEALCGKF